MSISGNAILIGPVTIKLYSLMLLSGVVAGTWLMSVLGKRKGIAPETTWDSMIWFFLGGIIGSRLWHVMFPSVSSGLTFGYYLTHPWLIPAVWNGGLGIPGAIIGGALGLALFCRRYGFPFGDFCDAGAPGLALGQAIGRWGNYFNQELYGAPSDLPWAIEIDPIHRLAKYADVSTYHPLFVYEMIWNLLNMGLLIWVDRKYGDRLRSGDIFALYLVVYPVGRFLLEFLRLDIASIGSLNWNQTVMGVTAVLACGYLVWSRQQAKQANKNAKQFRR